jgi:hypothetical protein
MYIKVDGEKKKKKQKKKKKTQKKPTIGIQISMFIV